MSSTRRRVPDFPRMAETILGVLEKVPPGELAASKQVVSGLRDSIANLTAVTLDLHVGLSRAHALLKRTEALYRAVTAARAEVGEPSIEQKSMDGLLDGSSLPQDGPGEE